jgi:hypothetical protein
LTDSQPNLKNGQGLWEQPKPEGVEAGRLTNAEAIAAGLVYLLQQRRNGRWGHLNLPWGVADAPVTAYILARLGELPSHVTSLSLRRKLADSLDWLQAARSPEGGWGYPGGDDAESTAWAIIALRKHGRPVPDSAIALICRCRRPDGGFASHPDADNSSPETTALAIQALGSRESGWARDAAGFVSCALGSGPGKLASPLSVCSAVLEWEKGLAPLTLLNQVCQITADFQAKGALELALLLRCMVRLRLNRAWSMSAELRAAQLGDGSWPGLAAARLNFDDKDIIPTATAVSALVLGDFQPGLYFGSDLPRPRRLHES